MRILRQILTPGACEEIKAAFWLAERKAEGQYQREYAPKLKIDQWLPIWLTEAPHYVAAYKPGGYLPPHKDGNSVTLSLVIAAQGQRPEFWPIWISHKKHELQAGDAVLYAQNEEHWRDLMPEGMENYVVAVFNLSDRPIEVN